MFAQNVFYEKFRKIRWKTLVMAFFFKKSLQKGPPLGAIV